MKINKVYCFWGGEQWISRRNITAVRLFQQNGLTDFYRSLKKTANHCSKKNVTVSKGREDRSNLDAKHEKEKLL